MLTPKVVNVTITEGDLGRRFDVAIAEKSKGEISRSQLKKLVNSSSVFVNEKILSDSSKRVQEECLVSIHINSVIDNNFSPSPERIPLNIVYEDEHLLVIDKKSGMVSHPAPGNYTGTLVNAILWHCKPENLSSCSGNMFRPGIVHRLDKDTSGLMVVAKTNMAHMKLAEYFSSEKGKSIIRRYKCVVFGTPKHKESTIETFIQRDRKDRQKYTVSSLSGKTAITKYKLLKSVYITSTKPISLVECELLTGRTHQIRVHMKHICCPVLGDPMYGKNKIENVYPDEIRNFSRTALHSHYLAFKHPISGEYISFESHFPEDIEKILTMF